MGNAASKGRIRPSQSRNAPDFSTTGATGKTTSASSVTALSRSSRLTTNGAASMAANAAAGSGRSAGSTPPISSAPSSPVRAAARIADVSRPGRCGQVDRHSTRRPPGRGRGRRRWAGRREEVGQAAGLQRGPLTGPSRDPGDPRAGGVGQPRRRRIRTGTGGQPFPDEQDRSGRQIGVQRVERRRPRRRGPPSRAGRPAWSGPRVAKGATAITRSPCLRTALRSRRNTIGDSSSGSSPASTHRGRRLEVGVGDRHGRPATRLARNCASSSLCARARKSMSLVFNTVRANRL